MHIELLSHVDAYISALSNQTEKSTIAAYFDRQETLGHILRRPVSAPLQDDINEIRPGAHRFLFFFDSREIIVVHAFRKKTPKTPLKEIEKAKSYRARYLAGEIA